MSRLLEVYRRILALPLQHPIELRMRHHLTYEGDPQRHTTVMNRLLCAHAARAIHDSAQDCSFRLVSNNQPITPRIEESYFKCSGTVPGRSVFVNRGLALRIKQG